MNRIDVHSLKILADTVVHSGDYGQMYINVNTDTALLVLGHADNVDTQLIEEVIEETGITFVVHYETKPTGDDWVLISKGVVGEGGYYNEDDEDDEDDEEDYDYIDIEPSLLSLDEYSKYLTLMEGL